ncbi:MAG: hypothetical protein II460_09755, partial [Oscillospiraceae bacterium]|nr:hypothetical protein [Oscillospiraceae bacterium]
VRPLLRPFKFWLDPADDLQFLQTDGTYDGDSGIATKAEIVDSGSTIVCYLDNSFTVKMLTATEAQQYAAMTGLYLVDDSGRQLFAMDTNTSPTNTSLTWTLSRANLTSMYSAMGPTAFRASLQKNNFDKKAVGYANYSALHVRPTFGYIDSAVRLRNPYDFGLTVRISGTDYPLAPGETKTLSYHMGDYLYASVILDEGAAALYTPTGFKGIGKMNGAKANDTDRDFNFVDGEPVYIGGGDNRLILFSF